jgi:DnaA-like protein
MRYAANLLTHYEKIHRRLWTPAPSFKSEPHSEPEPAPEPPPKPKPIVRPPPGKRRLPSGVEPPPPIDIAAIEQGPCVRKQPAEFAAALIARLQPVALRSVHEVICVAAWLSGIDVKQLLSPRRDHVRSRARQAAMALCVLGLKKSLPEVGQRFGGRHHTTVLHAVRRWRSVVEPMLLRQAAAPGQVRTAQVRQTVTQ